MASLIVARAWLRLGEASDQIVESAHVFLRLVDEPRSFHPPSSDKRDGGDRGQLDRESRPEATTVARDVDPLGRGEDDEIGMLGRDRDRDADAQSGSGLAPGASSVVRDDERRPVAPTTARIVEPWPAAVTSKGRSSEGEAGASSGSSPTSTTSSSSRSTSTVPSAHATSRLVMRRRASLRPLARRARPPVRDSGHSPGRRGRRGRTRRRRPSDSSRRPDAAGSQRRPPA